MLMFEIDFYVKNSSICNLNPPSNRKILQSNLIVFLNCDLVTYKGKIFR